MTPEAAPDAARLPGSVAFVKTTAASRGHARSTCECRTSASRCATCAAISHGDRPVDARARPAPTPPFSVVTPCAAAATRAAIGSSRSGAAPKIGIANAGVSVKEAADYRAQRRRSTPSSSTRCRSTCSAAAGVGGRPASSADFFCVPASRRCSAAFRADDDSKTRRRLIQLRLAERARRRPRHHRPTEMNDRVHRGRRHRRFPVPSSDPAATSTCRRRPARSGRTSDDQQDRGCDRHRAFAGHNAGAGAERPCRGEQPAGAGIQRHGAQRVPGFASVHDG